MTWAPLLGAAVGAVLALSGTLVADIRRDRHQRTRERIVERRRDAVGFAVVLVTTVGALRDIAQRAGHDPDRVRDANAAAADVYPAREQLLVSATPALLTAGETVFHRLVEIRDAIRLGASLDSAEYHDAYHPYAEALWNFRLAIRADIGEPALTPQVLGRPDWSDRDRCITCQKRTKQGG